MSKSSEFALFCGLAELSCFRSPVLTFLLTQNMRRIRADEQERNIERFTLIPLTGMMMVENVSLYLVLDRKVSEKRVVFS